MSTADTALPSTFKLGGEIEIHRIGIGTNRIQNDDASRAILPAALELGVNLIDTADIYTGGVSEQVIGADDRRRPDGRIVATKGGYHGASPERIATAIDASRARLRPRDDRPLLPPPPRQELSDRAVDRPDPQRQAGRARAPHRPLERDARPARPRAQPHADRRRPEPSTTSRHTDDEDVIDYCERHSIMFVPYFPLRGSERAKKIADRLKVDRNQVVLAAMLARSPVVVPIPGTRNPRHLEANLGAAKLTLSSEDLEELGLVSQGMRAAGFDEFGPAEVLHTIEVEPAEPGPGEVRIANKAAGVQRFDTMIRAGRGPAEKMVTSFPAIPGNEFAGVVDAIGPDVENVALGDEVDRLAPARQLLRNADRASRSTLAQTSGDGLGDRWRLQRCRADFVGRDRVS